MAVSVGDVFHLTFVGRCNQQRIMLNLDYEITALTGSTSDILLSDDLCERVTQAGADLLETDFLNTMPANYVLDEVTAQKIYPDRFRMSKNTRGLAGNLANDALTSNVNAVITLYCELSGRKYISNKHVGPAPTTAGWIDDGLVTVGYKAVLNTLKTKFLDAIVVLGWYTATPVIFHQGDAFPKSDYIVGGTVQDTVRIMRRRTVGLGE